MEPEKAEALGVACSDLLGADLMPVLDAPANCAKFVRMDALDNQWAVQVHDQTLYRLKQRGGLCPTEIYWNLHKLRWNAPVSLAEAVAAVNRIAPKASGRQRRPLEEPVGRVLTCVYCGHEYPQDTPAWGDGVLTAHIRTCAAHPMRAVEADRDRLRKALAGLVGASEAEELKSMEVAMRMMPAPDEDKAAMLNAIHALIAVTPNARLED